MTISFEQVIKRTGLPIIDCILKGHDEPMSFLIDTGADYNRIFNFVREVIPHCFTNSGETESTVGINGESQEGDIVRASVEIGNKCFLLDFVEIEISPIMHRLFHDYGVKLYGVLGNEFLFCGQFKIDFKNFCLTD